MDLFGSGGGMQLAMGTQVPFLGQIPIDQNVRIGGDSGKPIVVSYPDSPVALRPRTPSPRFSTTSVNYSRMNTTTSRSMIFSGNRCFQKNLANSVRARPGAIWMATAGMI